MLQVAIARPPSTPSAPTFDDTYSNQTQIMVEWSAGTSLDISVSGY